MLQLEEKKSTKIFVVEYLSEFEAIFEASLGLEKRGASKVLVTYPEVKNFVT
jgi:hypothetical protein